MKTNTSIKPNPENKYKGWKCRHDASFPCEMPPEACQHCKVNINQALKIQGDMTDYWQQINGGNGETRNWSPE
jgi:hypothetical protein